VHCMLVDRTDESHNEELELKLLRQTGFQEQWIGYFDLRSDWSEKEIELRFTALDRHDIEGPLLSARRAMAIIEDYTPEYIELTLKADVSANLSPMCKVRGNRGAEYISRGRADSTENALFKKAFQNLRYNTKTLARSWEIRYEAGQISDFYLDETEVSVEQFAKFVAAASGYQNSDNWLHGVSPKTSRRDQLASQLKSLAPDLPVTEVTWDEASAYARWSGKRLPSIIEWEYAVRGGPNYRPYSAYRDEQGVTLDTADFRYDTFGSEPWKVTRGKDLTPDTGIRNLCTNVSEWCASPKLFDGVGGKQAKVHAQSHPEWVLDPSLAPGGLRKSSSFWTVGGCYSSSRLDFSEVAPRYRDLMDPSVGFRCAVSASEVLNAMESASENHWEVHERSK
jgi:formylglycine-generating enzyme required for sulfatase activity